MTYCLTLELLKTQNSNSKKQQLIKKQQTAGILTIKGSSCFLLSQLFSFRTTVPAVSHTIMQTHLFSKIPLHTPFFSINPHFKHSYTPNINVYILFSCIIQQFYMLHIDADHPFLAFFTKQFLSKPTASLVLIGILPKICHLFSFCTTNSPNLYKYAYFY